MVFNETATAYGLFQVVFAEMHDKLAAATFWLKQMNEPALSFAEVHKDPFGRTLSEFQKLAQQRRSEETVKELGDLCDKMACLAQFRYERVHARVVRTEEGGALYAPLRHDPNKGQRLEMSKELFEQKIRDALKTLIEFGMHCSKLRAEIRLNEESEKLFVNFPEEE